MPVRSVGPQGLTSGLSLHSSASYFSDQNKKVHWLCAIKYSHLVGIGQILHGHKGIILSDEENAFRILVMPSCYVLVPGDAIYLTSKVQSTHRILLYAQKGLC